MIYSLHQIIKSGLFSVPDYKRMAEEYLLAWNDHHSIFFSSMAELIAGIERLLVIVRNNVMTAVSV